MALTEKTVYDKVEVVGQDGWTIQWRKATKIYRDGNFVSQGFHRGVVEPVIADYDSDKKAWVYTEHDMTKEPFDDAKVKAIAQAIWTDEIKASYKKHVEDTRTPV